MEISIDNAKIYEYDAIPQLVIINEEESGNVLEVSIAIYTPASSDSGESHVIEHCIATDLSEILGNAEISAYVFHNITYFNFNIKKSDICIIEKVMESIYNPQFLFDKNIYFRESHNVQNFENGSRVGGVVLNEIIEKSKNDKYVLLSNIPRSLAKDSETRGISGGTVQGILNLTYNKCIEYYQTNYTWNNTCVSILGNFTDREKEQAVSLFQEYKTIKYVKKIKEDNSKRDEKILKNLRITYIEDREEKLNEVLFSINLKLPSPETMAEYEFYFFLRETIEECLNENYMVQVVLRNILEYAYIVIIYKEKEWREKLYEVLEKINSLFCDPSYMISKKTYIISKIVRKDKKIENEKLIQFLSEAYFGNHPILTFLTYEDGESKKNYVDIIRDITTNEVCVYAEPIQNLEKLLHQYINSKKAMLYITKDNYVNWTQIKSIQKNKIQKYDNSNLYYEDRLKNIEVFYYRDKEKWIQLFYNITTMGKYRIFLLSFFMNKIHEIIGGHKVKINILPLYDFSNKKSKTYLILKIFISSNKDIEDIYSIVTNSLSLIVGNTYFRESLNESYISYESNLKKNVLNALITRILSYFRICEAHKDILFGVERNKYYTRIKDELRLNSIVDLSMNEIIKGDLQAIATSLIKLNGTEQLIYTANVKNKICTDIPLKCDIHFVRNEFGFAAGMDIRNQSRVIIYKFKVICKMVTDLCIIPLLRERGIYYGEINIIEDVLILIVNDHNFVISKEYIIKEIKNFIVENRKNILKTFPVFSAEIYKNITNRFDGWKEQKVLYVLLEENKYNMSKNDNIDNLEINLFLNTLEGFLIKGTEK